MSYLPVRPKVGALLFSAMAGSAMGAEVLSAQASDAGLAVEELRQQITEQGQQIEALRQELLRQQRPSPTEPPRSTVPSPGALPPDEVAQAAGPGQRAVRVGVAPVIDGQVPDIARVSDQPGILTPKGKVVLEPSLQYVYSSSNRVALVGYSIVPSLLIGLVDIREVKRNTVTGAVAARYGWSDRFEVEARVPYVYRSDSTVSRELFTGSSSERAFDSSGKSVGDVELAARYQLNNGGGNWPFLVGSLRFKSRTGRDPFEVVTDCVTRCVGNTSGTGLPLELPTGSGFYSLQPGLTWLFPSDPAVFFGSVSYTHNFKRDNVSRQVLNGVKESIGTVAPGGIVGVNFGMGLALNDKSSFSVGFDLNSVGRTRQNGVPVAGSTRTQLASLLLGYSYRYSAKTSLSVSVAGGLTRDTPDLMLTLRIPMTF
jgi:hypothetical protein